MDGRRSLARPVVGGGSAMQAFSSETSSVSIDHFVKYYDSEGFLMAQDLCQHMFWDEWELRSLTCLSRASTKQAPLSGLPIK